MRAYYRGYEIAALSAIGVFIIEAQKAGHDQEEISDIARQLLVAKSAYNFDPEEYPQDKKVADRAFEMTEIQFESDTPQPGKFGEVVTVPRGMVVVESIAV